MKGKNEIVISAAEMNAWAQEALDARFAESPGDVVSVKQDTSGAYNRAGSFTVTIRGERDEAEATET